MYVYVLNGSTGAVEWHSVSLGTYWSKVYTLEVGDVDNDGTPEIVAVNDNIFVFDGVSHQQWQSTISGCYGLDLYDTDKDGKKEIVVGTENGHILIVDGQTFAEEFNINVSSSSIVGLQVDDIDNNGKVEIVFANSGSLGICNVNSSDILWKSEILSSSAGAYNSIVVSDTNSDGRTEVFTGTAHTVVEFETTPQILPAEKSSFLPAIFHLLL